MDYEERILRVNASTLQALEKLRAELEWDSHDECLWAGLDLLKLATFFRDTGTSFRFSKVGAKLCVEIYDPTGSVLYQGFLPADDDPSLNPPVT